MHIRWRGLELPSSVQCDRNVLTANYGRFVAEPFERGYGVTVGNSLRRILLSSLLGSAVTQIKIRGAQHEFSSVPGILEDVTEIVLNVKSLVVKKFTEETRVITVEKRGAGPVTGADVQADADVEVINKGHHLATVTDDKVTFFMEMVVEDGRGYVPATEHSTGEHEIGVIPIDAVYSPVTRVRYDVEQTRVGQKTNFDRLNLEIWTDGSIGPELALVESAKIMRKHLNPFVQYSELGERVVSPSRGLGGADPGLESRLSMRMSELNLSVRANNCLESEGINTVRQLVVMTEDQLLEFRNFGDTTLTEVKDKLLRIGLHLGMRFPSSFSMG